MFLFAVYPHATILLQAKLGDKKRELQDTKAALRSAEATVARQSKELEQQSELLANSRRQAGESSGLESGAARELQLENDRLNVLVARQGFPPVLTQACGP